MNRIWNSFLLWLLCSCSSLAVGGEPIVIAHRGASGYLPEHTLAAVSLAYGMGADYIEQDVVLSKDSVPVVLHDVHIDTVTDVAKRFPRRARSDGRFYAIDFTLAELRTLRVNERVDPKSGQRVYPLRFPLGASRFQVVTLAEELEFIQGLNKSTGSNVGVYPEIKKPAWHRGQGFDISRIVVATLKQYNYESSDDRCYLQCFEQEELKRIRGELGVRLKLVQLLGDEPRELLQEEGLKQISSYADGIGPPLSTVIRFDEDNSPTCLVPLAHRLSLTVHPYTFRIDALPVGVKDSTELMRLLFEVANVDGVFTDFPDKCVDYVRTQVK